MAKAPPPKPAKRSAKGKAAPKKRAANPVAKTKAKASKPRAAAKKTKPVAERGRPSSYTAAVGAGVCGWIRQGYTLRQIDALPNMPSKTTIVRWLGEHADFQDQYARAREVHAMLMEDEIIEIAEDGRNDWVEREGKDGQLVLALNDEAITRSKLRIDARKWLMGKMAPKRYSDRLAITGKDGGPVKHEHSTTSILDEIDGLGTGLPRHVSPTSGA